MIANEHLIISDVDIDGMLTCACGFRHSLDEAAFFKLPSYKDKPIKKQPRWISISYDNPLYDSTPRKARSMSLDFFF